MSQVRLRLDLGRLQAYGGLVSRQAVNRAADATEGRVRANIISSNAVASGQMLDKVQQKDIPGNPMFPRTAIGSSAPHTKFPEFGTRAHGPKRAKVMVFRPKGSGHTVFARWVRGVYPRRFMRRALDQLRPTDFEM